MISVSKSTTIQPDNTLYLNLNNDQDELCEPSDMEENYNGSDDDYVPQSNESSSDSDIHVSKRIAVPKCTSKVRKMSTRHTSSESGRNDDALQANSTPTLIYSRKNRAERKEKRNQGKAYITVKGKEKRERSLRPLNMCRNKCQNKVTDDTRKKLFEEYWSLGERDKRVAYLVSLIDSKPTATSRKRTLDPEKEKFRLLTHTFYVKVNGDRIPVCKGCFMKTFDETNMFITLALMNRNSNVSGQVSDDKRGLDSPANKTSEQKLKEVQDHINSFPLYESHYTRRKSTRKYLPPHLNLQIMYKLYCERNHTSPVSRPIYEREFHKLNISFKETKTDTCHKCDILANKLKSIQDLTQRNEIKEMINTHHAEADNAYLMDKDKQLAKTNNTVRCYTFDLQQCLPTPFVNTSVAFYKRQLWTFNLTMHETGTGDVKCFMWHEAEGGRGGNQIGTCIYKEMISIPEEVSKVILYSDACGGQNKNSHVLAMFLMAMTENQNLVVIDHKFMVSGHSHMECDVDHGLIEKQKKRLGVPISHPHDWYQLVRGVGKKKKFQVVELLHGDFLNFADLLRTNLVMRKKDTSGNAFLWHDVKWFRYTKDTGNIFFKTSLNEEDPFRTICVARRGQTEVQLVPKKLYQNTLPVSKEKKSDILDLLPLISPVFHDFYINLKTTGAQDTYPDGDDSFDV